MLSYKRKLNWHQLKGKSAFNILDFIPNAQSFFYASSGRGGIEACLDLLGITEKDTVLLPAFVAQGVINPFEKKKVKIIRYKSTAELKFDIEDIKKKVTEDKTIKCIVIIHYFGFPQNIKSIKSFCSDNGVVIFEDCAQALFSKSADGKHVGVSGDIAFFSLPKSLPVPDGSIFIMVNPKYNYIAEQIHSRFNYSIAHRLSVFFHLMYLLIKKIELNLNYSILYRVLNLKTKILYALYYFFLRRTDNPARISKLSLKILTRLDYNDIIARRKKNIAVIYSSINRNRYQLLFPDFNANYLLTGVPMISNERNSTVKNLKVDRNIECLCYLKGWNNFPADKSAFSNETNLYNKHFLIPINEDIDAEAMVKALNEV